MTREYLFIGGPADGKRLECSGDIHHCLERPTYAGTFKTTIYKYWPKIKWLVIFSRDEQKHYQMAKQYPVNIYPSKIILVGPSF